MNKPGLIKYYQKNKSEFKKYYCIDKYDYQFIDNDYIEYFFKTITL